MFELFIALAIVACALLGWLMAQRFPLDRTRVVGAIISFIGAVLIMARPTNPPAMTYGAAALAVIVGNFVIISVLRRRQARP